MWSDIWVFVMKSAHVTEQTDRHTDRRWTEPNSDNFKWPKGHSWDINTGIFGADSHIQKAFILLTFPHNLLSICNQGMHCLTWTLITHGILPGAKEHNMYIIASM